MTNDYWNRPITWVSGWDTTDNSGTPSWWTTTDNNTSTAVPVERVPFLVVPAFPTGGKEKPETPKPAKKDVPKRRRRIRMQAKSPINE